jgi:hypothetical protein
MPVALGPDRCLHSNSRPIRELAEWGPRELTSLCQVLIQKYFQYLRQPCVRSRDATSSSEAPLLEAPVQPVHLPSDLESFCRWLCAAKLSINNDYILLLCGDPP